MKKIFKPYRPGFITGYESNEYEVNDFTEVLEHPLVKRFSDFSGFYSYAASVQVKPKYMLTLMALYNWDDEYNGCNTWVVIGYLPDFILCETNLKQFKYLVSDHKPNCWIKKYSANENLLNSERPKETRFKVLKELGWVNDDTFGIAVKCDCGFNDLRKK